MTIVNLENDYLLIQECLSLKERVQKINTHASRIHLLKSGILHELDHLVLCLRMVFETEEDLSHLINCVTSSIEEGFLLEEEQLFSSDEAKGYLKSFLDSIGLPSLNAGIHHQTRERISKILCMTSTMLQELLQLEGGGSSQENKNNLNLSNTLHSKRRHLSVVSSNL